MKTIIPLLLLSFSVISIISCSHDEISTKSEKDIELVDSTENTTSTDTIIENFKPGWEEEIFI